jgi:hypothetical protein
MHAHGVNFADATAVLSQQRHQPADISVYEPFGARAALWGLGTHCGTLQRRQARGSGPDSFNPVGLMGGGGGQPGALEQQWALENGALVSRADGLCATEDLVMAPCVANSSQWVLQGSPTYRLQPQDDLDKCGAARELVGVWFGGPDSGPAAGASTFSTLPARPCNCTIARTPAPEFAGARTRCLKWLTVRARGAEGGLAQMAAWLCSPHLYCTVPQVRCDRWRTKAAVTWRSRCACPAPSRRRLR